MKSREFAVREMADKMKRTIGKKETTTTKRKASPAKRGSGSKAPTTKRKSKPGSTVCKASDKEKATRQSNMGLKELVRDAVNERGAQLAKSMVTQAIEGNVNCARFLISLCEEAGQSQAVVVVGSGKSSLATMWGAEPEWTEQAHGEAEETLLSGGRELKPGSNC